MKLASITAIILVIAWVALTALQLWFGIVEASLYWKISFTMFLVGGGIIIASLIAREYLGEKEMRKDKYID